MSQREEYISKMKIQLDEIHLAMAEYETKAHRLQIDAQIAYRDGLFKLRQQLQQAQVKMEELKDTGEGNWEKLIVESDRVRRVLVDSVHYFKTHI